MVWARPEMRPEALLHAAWRLKGSGESLVRTRSGEVFRVIYAGRRSDGAGPDFRDAVLQRADGALLRGDIEIHVRASGWQQHGHQHDRKYNGVIFHVASEGDSEAVSGAGMRIPLLLLGGPRTRRRPDDGVEPAGPVPDNGECGQRCAPPGQQIGDLLPEASLGEAGDRRFLAKSSGYQIALKGGSPDDVLWAAVLDGLGYARNRKGFRQLASRLPWGMLAHACAGQSPSVADIEAVLLWAAGFASKPPYGPAAGPSGSAAGTVADRLSPLRGARPDWARAVGRPQNHPARRIVAAAHLARRWLTSGHPAGDLESAALSAVRPAELDRLLVVTGSGPDLAYLGPGRAAAIVVNAILPCLHAIAFDAGRWHVAERCLALYRNHPKLPDNGVEREARTLLRGAGRPSAARNARDQQGLLYLYRAMTTAGHDHAIAALRTHIRPALPVRPA